MPLSQTEWADNGPRNNKMEEEAAYSIPTSSALEETQRSKPPTSFHPQIPQIMIFVNLSSIQERLFFTFIEIGILCLATKRRWRAPIICHISFLFLL